MTLETTPSTTLDDIILELLRKIPSHESKPTNLYAELRQKKDIPIDDYLFRNAVFRLLSSNRVDLTSELTLKLKEQNNGTKAK